MNEKSFRKKIDELPGIVAAYSHAGHQSCPRIGL
jgi:hypothetical protein